MSARRLVICTALSVGLSGCALLPGYVGGSSAMGAVRVHDTERTYMLHVPAHADTARELPLVIVLHGYSMTGAQMEGFTGFSRVAAHALVAYPDGERDSRGNRHWQSQPGASADVDFLSALIDDVTRVHRVDPNRVYVAGFSNGGGMTYRVASTLGSRVAAIAVIAGSNGRPRSDTVGPAQAPMGRAMPTIVVHGTDDPTIPYAAIPLAVQHWAESQGCAAAPRMDTLPNRTVTLESYAACRGGSEVVLYSVLHGRHRWPGNGGGRGPLFATQVIWQFFQAHTRP